MVNIFFNFPLEWWCSSKISSVVICKSIPQEIAKKLLDQFMKISKFNKYSPKKAPAGLEIANSNRKIIFKEYLELILFKKIISTAAIGNLWIRIVNK